MDAIIIYIDQTKKSVQVEPHAARKPRGTQPFVELSGQCDWTRLLGPITEDGDRFFSRFTESVTAEHSRHFILILCSEFENCSIVIPDGAPYYQASAVTDLVALDDFTLVTLPLYSSEVSLVEECWRQLQASLSNSFFALLDKLTTPMDTALYQLSIA